MLILKINFKLKVNINCRKEKHYQKMIVKINLI